MHAAMMQEQARAQLKAALLGLMAAHATDESYPTGINASFRFNEGGQDGDYEVTVTHGRTDFSLAGGSL